MVMMYDRLFGKVPCVALNYCNLVWEPVIQLLTLITVTEKIIAYGTTLKELNSYTYDKHSHCDIAATPEGLNINNPSSTLSARP